jgi:hypothetical protein
MNWKLIWTISVIVGLGSGAISLVGIQSAVLAWAVLLSAGFACGIILVLKTPGRHFAHGFWTGFFSQVIETVLTAIFAGSFIANNPEFARMLSQFPVPVNARALLLGIAPFAGALNGLMFGIFTWIVSKILGPDKTAPAPVMPPEPPPPPPPLA